MQILTGRHGGGEVMNGHLSDISVYGETSGKMLKLSQLRIMETDRKKPPIMLDLSFKVHVCWW